MVRKRELHTEQVGWSLTHTPDPKEWMADLAEALDAQLQGVIGLEMDVEVPLIKPGESDVVRLTFRDHGICAVAMGRVPDDAVVALVTIPKSRVPLMTEELVAAQIKYLGPEAVQHARENLDFFRNHADPGIPYWKFRVNGGTAYGLLIDQIAEVLFSTLTGWHMTDEEKYNETIPKIDNVVAITKSMV